MSNTNLDHDGWSVVQRRDNKFNKKDDNSEWELIEEVVPVKQDPPNNGNNLQRRLSREEQQVEEKKQALLIQSAAAIKQAVETGLQSIPQLLEKFNLKQMQEELTQRIEQIRKSGLESSRDSMQEASVQITEILQKMKALSDQIEIGFPKRMLEMTRNEKSSVKLKKKKSRKTKKSKESVGGENVMERHPSMESTSDEELVEGTKPTFYPHSFRLRMSEYEVDDFIGGDVMDKLKEERFNGFYNFSMIYLIATVTALCVYNLHQRGWLITLSSILCTRSVVGVIQSLGMVAVILIQSLFYYALWRIRQFYGMSYRTYFSLYVIYQIIMIITDCVIVWYSVIPPLTSVMPLMLMVIIALKGHSFIFTNFGLEKQSTERVPNSFGHYCYFIICPTLLYELDYPRTTSLRLSYLAKTTLSMLIAFALMYVIMMQFVYPILSDTSSSMIYRILRCSLSAFLIWLLLFFSVFHCLLNIIAEVTMFGDRLLYEDWWNATTMLEFWKKWNGPIHYWCLRHVYVESQIYGNASKPLASLATFAVSGFAHELVCSVAFRRLSIYFLFGMVIQVPLQIISKRFEDTRWGNIIVWVSLFLGQPLLELSYCQDWFKRFQSLFC